MSYFDSLVADGYQLSIHGPRSGAMSIDSNGKARLEGDFSLSKATIETTLALGGQDDRQPMTELFKSLRSVSLTGRSGAAELIRQSRQHLDAIGASTAQVEIETLKGPTQ